MLVTQSPYQASTSHHSFPVGFEAKNARSDGAFELTMREVDVPNSEKPAQMENITVLESACDIHDIFGIKRP
ncbi:MAG: hypothetical protein ACXVIS_10675 [Halobacteriota archaeon]